MNIDRAAADHGAQRAALEQPVLEGRVLRDGLQISGIEAPWHLRIDQDEIGGEAGDEAASAKAEKVGGDAGKRGEQAAERQIAAVDEGDGYSSSVSRPMAPKFASAKGRRFTSGSCGS